jgi:hypothetical protein
MSRVCAFGILCAAIFFGLSLGSTADAAKAARAGHCTEGLMPKKCAAPKFVYCNKKSKCGSCAKWVCRLPAMPHI